MAFNLEWLEPQTSTIRNLCPVDSLAWEVVDSLAWGVADSVGLEVADSVAWEVDSLAWEVVELKILCLCLCFLVVVREICLVHNLEYTWGNQGT